MELADRGRQPLPPDRAVTAMKPFSGTRRTPPDAQVGLRAHGWCPKTTEIAFLDSASSLRHNWDATPTHDLP